MKYFIPILTLFLIGCILTLMVLLTGCSEAPRATEPITKAVPVPTPMVVPPSPPVLITEYKTNDLKTIETELVKVRAFLNKDENIKSNIYGMVVFTSKPVGEEQLKQYKLICENWTNTLFTSKELGIDSHIKTFETYWPTLGSNSELGDCDNLFHYDYVRVQKLIGKLKITNDGPMLLAVYKDKHLELNLNKLTNEDVQRVFHIWKYDLKVTNHGWKESFNLTYFKEKFREILEKYGKQLMEFKEG